MALEPSRCSGKNRHGVDMELIAHGCGPAISQMRRAQHRKAPDLAAAQGVSGIPDVRIFKNGREVDRFVGFPGEKQVLEKIAELSRGITPTAATTPAAKAPAEPVIQPFKKDWMPPGMKRQSSGAP